MCARLVRRHGLVVWFDLRLAVDSTAA